MSRSRRASPLLFGEEKTAETPMDDKPCMFRGGACGQYQNTFITMLNDNESHMTMVQALVVINTIESSQYPQNNSIIDS